MTKSAASAQTQTDLLEKVRQVFTEYLEQAGLRKTPERFAILREIYSIEDHFDIDSLFLLMKERKIHVSRATLYNTIEHLLACDLVTKHQFGKNMALFEKSYAYKQHDHLICMDCDKVMEFCDPRIQQIQSMMGDILDFQVTHHSLNLFGKCRKLLRNGTCEHLAKKKQVTLTGS
ncbi:MAG: transcriptional repressor [Bacteroidia bacterium]|nr:transcriptional repressor [Bacteroidia bacterium]